MDASQVVDSAKTSFILDNPRSAFLTSILCSVKTVISTDIPTACINTTTLMLNPNFLESLPLPQRKTLLTHEIFHLVFQHCSLNRLGDRDPSIWNQAGDYVINAYLKKTGYAPIDKWLYDVKYVGMSTEEVYDHLIANPDEANKPNAIGEDLDTPDEGDKTANEDGTAESEIQKAQAQETQLSKILIRAAISAEIAGEPLIGNLPAEIIRTIELIRNPIIPWQTLLLDYMLDFSKDDYSMRKPNKRFMPDFILPSLHSESMGKVCFICDASGSIGKEEFDKFYSEGIGARDLLQPTEFVITSFDTKIKDIYRVMKGEQFNPPELRGGGGTYIDPVLEFIKEEEPDVTVIFTDGFFDKRRMEELNPETPIIWLIDGNESFSAPYGDIIHFLE